MRRSGVRIPEQAEPRVTMRTISTQWTVNISRLHLDPLAAEVMASIIHWDVLVVAIIAMPSLPTNINKEPPKNNKERRNKSTDKGLSLVFSKRCSKQYTSSNVHALQDHKPPNCTLKTKLHIKNQKPNCTLKKQNAHWRNQIPQFKNKTQRANWKATKLHT